MVQEIKITNTATSESIIISSLTKPFILTEVDWDSPSVSFSTYRVPYQIGETPSGVTVGTRQPSITGYVVADSVSPSDYAAWDDYYEAQRVQIASNKNILNKVINVYQEVIIEANGYFLKAKPSSPPSYSTKDEENNEVMCLFSLNFTCFQPLFYKEEKVSVLASTTNMLTFPLILTEDSSDEYCVFGEIMKRQSVSIENTGDVPVGCLIEMKASGGEITNPKIYNISTNKGITFYDLTIQDGDSLIVNTDIGEESAIYHSASQLKDTSVVGNIKAGSEFLKISMGSFPYAYEVGEGEENNVDLSIRYTEKYFHLEDM